MLTQDVVNATVSTYNNILFLYYNKLKAIRHDYYDGFIGKCEYKISRKITLENIQVIKNIKREYALLIKEINSLQKSQ